MTLKVNNNGFELEKEGVKTETEFPLIVNKNSGTIMVTTPNGTKALNTTPNEVVSKALQEQAVSKIEDNIITEKDDLPTYKIEGYKSEKLLGIIPVKIPVTVYYSIQDGSLIGTETDLITKIKDILSF